MFGGGRGVSSGMWGARIVALASFTAGIGCRAPTEITLDIKTDIPCTELAGVSITAGAYDVAGQTDIEGLPPATTATTCNDGEVGTIVILPYGADDGPVAVRVVGGQGVDPGECTAPSYAPAPPQMGSCVVARRLLSFEPHDPLELPIELRSACLDVPCEPTTTCVEGHCVSAVVPNPKACTSADACGETTLVDGGVSDGGSEGGTDAGPSDGGDAGSGTNVAQLAAREYTTCALMATHEIYCWGGNQQGAFGPKSPTLPVTQVFAGISATMIGVGYDFLCALDMQGTVRCAGYDNDGELGGGTFNDTTSTPVTVKLPGAATKIAVGQDSACALVPSSGSNDVWCWGYGSVGQLGCDDAGSAATPVQPELVSMTADDVSCGGQFCCILTGGVPWCWGNDTDDELGPLVQAMESLVPTRVPNVTGADAIVAGQRSTCAQIGTTATCWGELPGNGSEGSMNPVQLQAPSAIAQISLGDHGGCARLTDGHVACWGSNLYGQLGQGTDGTEATTPSLVSGIDDATTLVRGDNWSCVARRSTPNSVWCWGTNESAEVTGDGTPSGDVDDAADNTVFQSLPVEVKLPAN